MQWEPIDLQAIFEIAEEIFLVQIMFCPESRNFNETGKKAPEAGQPKG